MLSCIFTVMKKAIYLLMLSLVFLSCSSTDITTPNIPSPQDMENVDTSENDEDDNNNEASTDPRNFKLLALGDSYTIGESVCNSCRFPEQLKDSLMLRLPEDSFNLQVIAQTGWTTSNLIATIASSGLAEDHDLVTLLIGVNNQYQNKPFSLYTSEFPELVQTAITAAQGDRNRVIALSIPDYAYTPFGQGNGNPEETSQEIDQYNAFAENYCSSEGIAYLNITDITRQGLENTALVASDGLHPSELAYTKFVERLLPIAIPILN